jgi:hypothetical protein
VGRCCFEVAVTIFSPTGPQWGPGKIQILTLDLRPSGSSPRCFRSIIMVSCISHNIFRNYPHEHHVLLHMEIKPVNNYNGLHKLLLATSVTLQATRCKIAGLHHSFLRLFPRSRISRIIVPFCPDRAEVSPQRHPQRAFRETPAKFESFIEGVTYRVGGSLS